ncbi:MAG TPA: hypothetical protein VN732_00055, partial [Solirubrobacterales bacterium]|nr:hypothetical protein [Solirubrobacterales bacterium]
KAFFEGLGPVIKRAPTGFAALREIFRDEFPPLLRAIDPFVRNLNPILVGLKLYKSEVTAFFGNLAATFSGELPPEQGAPESAERPHYLRVIGPMNPETLSAFPRRLAINRNSAYSPPKWAEDLADGSLPSFDTRQCTTGIVAMLDPDAGKSDAFKERAVKTETKSAEENAQILFEHIKQYAFAGKNSTSEIAAPPCEQQGQFEPIYGSGPATQYQHTFEQPSP